MINQDQNKGTSEKVPRWNKNMSSTVSWRHTVQHRGHRHQPLPPQKNQQPGSATAKLEAATTVVGAATKTTQQNVTVVGVLAVAGGVVVVALGVARVKILSFERTTNQDQQHQQ
jgi:hypothetical protein